MEEISIKSTRLTALPFDLDWDLEPTAWEVNGNTLTATAGEKTDLFVDPNGKTVVENSPRLLFTPPSGDFLYGARVCVEFAHTFDAGVLLVYADDRHWAKLCFEYSPQKNPTVVSVVTKEYSDDCNSVPVNDNCVYLRISRIGMTYAFHYSFDGKLWHMARYFTFGPNVQPKLGFSVQSPTGPFCRATFSEVFFSQKTLSDLRGGE